MVADINLLPQREKKTDRSNVYILIVLVLFLIVAGYLTYAYITAKQDLTDAELRKTQTDAELAELQLKLDESSGKQTASRETAVSIAEYVSYNVTPIIQDVYTRMPQNSYLREYAFDVGQVTLHAEFEDKTLINLFLTSLQSSFLYTDVSIEEITSFYPAGDNTEEGLNMFEELPRYSATVTLFLDMDRVRTPEVSE